MADPTDREFLELAAKAAGLKVQWHDGCAEWCVPRQFLSDHRRSGDWEIWNPLTDDGDALRLAVKLRLDLFNYAPPIHEESHVDAVHMDGSSRGYASEPLGLDPHAATRRAIVRAAAAIGASNG